MRGIAAVFALATLLSSCAEALRIVDRPRSEGARALLLLAHDGRAWKGVAIDTSLDAPALEIEADDAPSVRLYAIFYDRTLAELDLAQGPLVFATDPSARVLPKGTRELVGSATDALVWRPLEERPADLSELRVVVLSAACATLELAGPIDFGAAIVGRWSLALRRGAEVVVGTSLGDLFVISADGRARSEPTPMSFHPYVAAQDDAGGVWLADNLGRVWRGAPGAPASSWVREDLSTGLIDVRALDVSPDGRELVTYDYFDRINVWSEAGGLRTIGTLSGAKGVLWLGADDVLVLKPEFGALRIKNGVTSDELTAAISRVESLRRVQGVGIVVGTSFGELFVREGEEWRVLEGNDSGLRVLSLEAAPGGFVWGAGEGFMGQYAGGRFCAGSRPVDFDVRALARLDGGYVALGDSGQAAVISRR